MPETAQNIYNEVKNMKEGFKRALKVLPSHRAPSYDRGYLDGIGIALLIIKQQIKVDDSRQGQNNAS